MIIIGVDYHPSDQYIAFVDTETGDCGERRLNHSEGEAEKFYRELGARGVSVRVGMEATGYSGWFERLLTELGIELWIGDAAEIETKRVRKQKTDRNDARLLLKLLLEDTFPRIWVPGPENRDLRQLLWHRHRLVQMRTRIMNQLQALAMNEGQRRKKKLWNEQGRAQLEKSQMIRRYVIQWLTGRDRNRPSGRSWARQLGVSHTWLQKLARRFQADPTQMLREARRCGDPSFAQLIRAREYTRRMREQGELRGSRLAKVADFLKRCSH